MIYNISMKMEHLLENENAVEVLERFLPDMGGLARSDAERREMYAANVMETANTAISDYVWLPLRLEKPSEANPNGRVLMEWKDSWRVEDFA